ncbi:flavin reductase family protein [Amycolatopsis speibonae]|uniref:Flavin reductase family protein n=1 Tax=Amycolatopsis speibonae TaxID=1450224 RepID=A0ABV7P0N4_9PSEU
MAEFPSGVAVVTTMDNGRPRGMTCSSLCSVSLSPPTLLLCLRAQSPTLAAIVHQSEFVTNLLHGDAQATADLFASPVSEKFRGVRWRLGLAGPHLVADAHAMADCRVSRTENAGSHVIVFGEVLAVTHRQGLAPLLYGRRGYHAWPG